MNLNLGFGGLCLFVPELDETNHPIRMHVLAPTARTTPYRHEAHLYYDDVATSPPGPGGARPIRLDGDVVDLSNLGVNRPVSNPPQGLAQLPNGCTVPKNLVTTPTPGSGIGFRVTFAAGTARIPRCGEGANWHYRNHHGPLAIRVIWQLKIAEPYVDLNLPDSPPRTIRLYPDANDDVNLWFLNSPPGLIMTTFPPRTARPTGPLSAHHFRAFYELLGCPIGDIPDQPDYGGYGSDCYADTHGPKRIEGLDLTCIGAQGVLG